MQKKIKAIILDWAGTTIDYGCFAPVNAFIKAFETYGITPTMDETRAPMGLPKRDHVAKMLGMDRLAALWLELHGSPHSEEDVDKIYREFEPELFEVLEKYSDPLPGVLEAVEKIRNMGIVTGSTTGYTQEMMDVVTPLVKEKGYSPDCLVCPDETSNIGRPYPYMIWRNLEKLSIADIRQVVKIGDTAADMEEGKNAGCVCIGILKGSSMLGLSKKELAEKSPAEVKMLLADTEKKYYKVGADYVLEDIAALPELLALLSKRRVDNV